MINKRVKKNKGKVQKKIKTKTFHIVGNAIHVLGNGQQLPGKVMNFIDTAIVGQNCVSTGTVTTIFTVTQGVTVNQRIGDTAILDRMWLNYQIDAINTDVFSTARLIVFQWLANSAIATPTVAQVLQTATIQAFYNYQFSNQYVIVYDVVHSLSGIVGAPTESGNQGWFGELGTHRCARKIEWNPAAVNGSRQFYVLFIGDSLIAPFPIINLNTRIMFDGSV